MKETALISLLWPKNFSVLKHYLKKDRPITVFTLSQYCTDELKGIVSSYGSQLVPIENLLSGDEGAQLGRLAQDKAGRLMGVLAREGVAASLPYPVEEGLLNQALASHVPDYLKYVVPILGALEKVRAAYFVELVVINEDWTGMGKSMALWAKERGIPCLHVAHGIGVGKYYTVHSVHTAEHIAVFGERGAQAFRDNGVAPERLHLTGNPCWDGLQELARNRSRVRSKVAGLHGLDPKRPLIVFGLTWRAQLSALEAFSVEDMARAFFRIYRPLAEKGVVPQLVVKDRGHMEDSPNYEGLLAQMAAEEGIPASDYVYTIDDINGLIVAADIFVSVDSNISFQCILAGTPAINLTNPTGLLMGPCFSADDGVVEAEPERLADAVSAILTDAAYRSALRDQMRNKAPYFNVGVDGNAAQRVAELMADLRLASSQSYIWQTYLNASEADATQYHNWPRSELVDIAPRTPRRVLDIGCAAGKTGEYIKQRFPGARVYGVELNRAAAEKAATRLDSVFIGKFEDFDFAAHGIEPGSLDTVIVADVLEHMYDPWDVLVRVKPYLAPDAQVLASIPNTRNLALMKDLSEGHWRYEPWGLLDITHIRFFTLKEIRRFFHETGYHVARIHHNLDGRLTAMYQENRNKPLFNIDFEKFTLKNVTPEELTELCTLQFYVVAEPGALEAGMFEAQEQARAAVADNRTAYDLWRDARRLTKVQGDLYEKRMAAWPARPLFHLAVVANPADSVRLGSSIQSLADQYYHDLHLTVVSTSLPPENWADNERLAWRYAPESGLLDAANRALLERQSDWVGMINAGDTVAAHSFLFLAEAVNEHPEWRFVYTDEDVLEPGGTCGSPHFKPDFNLDLLRSQPYTGGLALISRSLFESLGGFSAGMKGAEDFDLVLRAYEVAGAKAIGHVPDVLYHQLREGGRWRLPAPEVVEAGKRALEAHLARSNVTGMVEQGLFPASYRVRYQHRAMPRVSILVAVRDQVDVVQRCIESVLATTRYPDYEILIADNDSLTPEARAYLDGLKGLGEERIRVTAYSKTATLPLLHNVLAAEARGDYLLFLHFDAAVLHDDWLDSLMAHALRPEVGAVAPRLLRPDGAVEQAGLVLGLNKAVDTPFRGESLEQAGYFGRAHLEQDFSALGGGCLLVRKSLFMELNGFDAENFGADFAEVDFCRRMAERGLLAVWTPFVNVLCAGKAQRHAWRDVRGDEEAARTALEAATDRLCQRWLPQLARDPAYNVNFSLVEGKYFAVETNATLTWDPLPWRPLPRVLAHPGDNQGCGEYRIVSPLRALVEAGKVQGWADFHIFSPAEMERLDVDAIILQRQTTPAQIEAIARHKKYSRALRVFELDDLLINLPVKSIHNATMPKDIGKQLRRAVALCDRFVVSTEPLKEAYRDLHADIRVVLNRLERARWDGFKPLRGQSVRPRVGWSGGVGHTGDLEMVASVIKELAGEVDWVFLGMCPDVMRPWIKEFHPGVPVEQYPAKLASLNLDLAIAPLEHNRFNEAKSHLRLLEYGVLGYPVVCSDIYPYQGDYPVTRVRNRHQDWVRAIRDHISDMGETSRQGDRLREYIDSHWMLEDNLDTWLQAWLP